LAHRPHRGAEIGSFHPLRCDAYYRQHEAGWHTRLEGKEAPFGRGAGLRAYSHGGGFAGSGAALALDEYMRGSVPQCNTSQLSAKIAAGKRRPHLPDFTREGCSAYFRGFEGVRSCSFVHGAAKRAGSGRELRLGLSLWSPLVPLNGSCIFALFPPAPKVLQRVKWLPRGTLGVHIRRGDFDPRWPRASVDDWIRAIEVALDSYDLHRVFVASDDRRIHGAIRDGLRQRGRRDDVVLPRFIADDILPSGNRRIDRVRLWSKEGNVESLVEQLTLASADFILGSWGSTYSTLAAAWFDKPVAYVPIDTARECSNSTPFKPCRWRGAATYPSAHHVHGSKCGRPMLDYFDALRAKRYSYPAHIAELDYSIAVSRVLHGVSSNSTAYKLRRRRRFVASAAKRPARPLRQTHSFYDFHSARRLAD